MRCEDVRKRMLDYVMGKLTEAEVTAIDKHLDRCEDCTKVVDNYLNELGLFNLEPEKNELFRLMRIPMPSQERVKAGIEAVLQAIHGPKAIAEHEVAPTVKEQKSKTASWAEQFGALVRQFATYWVYGLATVAVAGLIIFAWNEHAQRKAFEHQIASLQMQVNLLRRQNEAVKRENETLQRKLEQALLERQRTQRVFEERQKQLEKRLAQQVFVLVRDRAGAVTINADGTVRLEGRQILPLPFAQQVKELITTGAVKPSKPALLAMATLNSGLMLNTLRSAKVETSQKPIPISPVLTAVRSVCPKLQWKPVEGAKGYKVMIVDKNDKLLWQTKVEAETKVIVPSGVLRRGQVYFWQVEAFLNEQSNLSPVVGFWVLSEEELKEVTKAERKFQGSALVLASLYAHHGLYEEALAQIERLSEMNPTSPFVQGILNNLERQLGRE